MLARIAKADADYFRSQYEPRLKEMADDAVTKDVAATVRGQSSADIAQTYDKLRQEGGGAGYALAQDTQGAADLAMGATAQMIAANIVSKGAKVKEQTGALSAARGSEADTTTALSVASRLGVSDTLSDAAAKQQIRLAKRKMGFDIAAGAGNKMLENLGATNSPFRASLGYRFNPDIGKAGGYERGTVGILGTSEKWKSLGSKGGPWMHGG
jgi:hypothetical protein